jgi:single-stranded DNA-specific DHH superfamily exonuclease
MRGKLPIGFDSNGNIIYEETQKVVRYFISNRGHRFYKIFNDGRKSALEKDFNITVLNYVENENAFDYDKMKEFVRQSKEESLGHDIENIMTHKTEALEIKEEKDSEKSIIDGELSLDEVNNRLFTEINKLAPFGIGNHKPIFLFRNLQPVSVRKFGKSNDHVEIIFKKKTGEKVSAISFFGAKEKWANNILKIDYSKNAEKTIIKKIKNK